MQMSEENKEKKRSASVSGGGVKPPYPREKANFRVIRFIMYFVTTFMMIAGLTSKWVTDEWGDLSLDEVMFTITQPLKGTDTGIIWNYIAYCVIGPVAVLLSVIAIYHIFLLPKQPPKDKVVKENGEKKVVPAEVSAEKAEELRRDHERKNTKKR